MPAVKHATIGAPYQVPPEPSRWPAILLAVAVHAFLLLFLWIGISWQNSQPVAVEAEVWDFKTQAAAPPPLPPQEVEPEPEPAPAPKVVEQPVEQPVAPPDIRLEREKQRKEEELRHKQQLEREAEKKAAEQKEREKKLKEEKLKEEKLKEEKLKEEKLKAEKVAKAKADAAEKAKREKLRDIEMQRMLGIAGNGTSGTAEKSTAPRRDDGWVAKITTLIKSNTSYPGNTDVPGNPKASFRVELLPTGEVLSVKLIKSSGLSTFDEAVRNGINKSSPLPKKKDGTVERSFVVDFSMKDLN